MTPRVSSLGIYNAHIPGEAKLLIRTASAFQAVQVSIPQALPHGLEIRGGPAQPTIGPSSIRGHEKGGLV